MSKHFRGIFLNVYLLEADIVRYLEGKGYKIITLNNAIKTFCNLKDTIDVRPYLSSSTRYMKLCYKTEEDYLHLRDMVELLFSGVIGEVKTWLDIKEPKPKLTININYISTGFLFTEENGSFYDHVVLKVGKKLLKENLKKILTYEKGENGNNIFS
jgi:hypothetical protein